MDRFERQEAYAHALRRVLATDDGRLVLRVVLFQHGRIEGGSFAGEMPLVTAFNEGGRAVGNAIAADVKAHAPEAWLDMLRDQMADERPEEP